MNQPLPVLVDLSKMNLYCSSWSRANNFLVVLDPYVFNIFPQSLLPTAFYITIVAILSWYLSDYIYAWLNRVASQGKLHTE